MPTLPMWLLPVLLLTACQPGSSEAAEARQPCRAITRPADVAPVPPQELPAPAGLVVDNANLLSPDAEARLTDLAARLEHRTTDELVVVTLPSLNDRPIEDVGYALGNAWRVGRDDKDNGVLLIVAPNERKVRIEVGYGLEPILPNDRAGEIIQANLLPAFREGRFEEGIASGAEAIASTLTNPAMTARIGAC